ncbi:DNA helicase [Proteus sp. GOKU]|uniref:NERD domain-containing protein n=1 Tax=Proteus TaxID=583 RepID=UPI0018929554|nr:MULTISPECIES: nuclease-related domain-containing DEAD/DEAH box helicase [Proteus]QPB79512.1 DNA helicase [Proteus sp. GOKU]QQP25519.1 DNA helicase [Proteus vulgaris]
MSRFISPSISEFNKLRQPLTQGEKKVFEFFNKYLPLEWEIYIQPHLNGLRPDFVLLNPKIGIAVFEVKDWNFTAMDYFIEEKENCIPVLWAKKDGVKFSRQKENPIEQVYNYKQELFNLYCPRLEKNAGFAVITAGVIFPFADDKYVKNLFKQNLRFRGMEEFPSYSPISGMNALKNGDIYTVFPEVNRRYSKLMNVDTYKDIKNWLIEPDFSETQRKPIILDKIQQNLATTRTVSGYRRIRGAAGSGKSLVLAARAAELLSENKKVLVITYNITLMHYLQDITVRHLKSRKKINSDITWLNFHHWCKCICNNLGYTQEYEGLCKNNTDEFFKYSLPTLVNTILDKENNEYIKYDAVLVDEGQDFLPNWWSVLRKVCKPMGEMLLVADITQDIYDTAKSWTDEAMKGAGFSGAWAELNVCYRLPLLTIEKARDFANRFLPKELALLPENSQFGMELEPCYLKWVHVDSNNEDAICCSELLSLSTTGIPKALAIADITFLCTSKQFGLKVVQQLKNKGIKVIHTYDLDDKESKRQKMSFYMGDARIKATTLHSFKGWESRALVIFVDNDNLTQKTLSLIYTGLTRLKRHPEGSCLTVVSKSSELIEYGKTWSSFTRV